MSVGFLLGTRGQTSRPFICTRFLLVSLMVVRIRVTKTLMENCIKEQKIVSGNSVWNCCQCFPSHLHCSHRIFNMNKHSDNRDISGAFSVLL